MKRTAIVSLFALACWFAPCRPAHSQITATLGSINSAAQLQAALTGDATRVRPTQIAGTITLTDTLNIINGNGGGIVGVGQTESLGPGNLLQKQFSRLVWAGARTGVTPIIEIDRADPVLRDLSIDGATRAQMDASSPAKAKVGIQLSRATGSYAGVGSGKIHANNVGIAYCETCLRVGEAAADVNCDESTFIDMFCDRFDTGVEFVNGQALGWHFINARFRNTDSASDACFRYLGGSNLKVWGSLITNQCTYLKFEDDTPSQFGAQGNYMIDGLKVDAAADNSKMLDMDEGQLYYGRVTFRGLQLPNEAATWTMPLFNVVGDTILILDECLNLPPGCIEWDEVAGGRPAVIVQNCTFRHDSGTAMTVADLFATTNSDDRVCYKGSGNTQTYSHNSFIADEPAPESVDSWVTLDADP